MPQAAIIADRDGFHQRNPRRRRAPAPRRTGSGTVQDFGQNGAVFDRGARNAGHGGSSRFITAMPRFTAEFALY
jgi:hypothetical protein